jgi:hypothetical protein
MSKAGFSGVTSGVLVGMSKSGVPRLCSSLMTSKVRFETWQASAWRIMLRIGWQSHPMRPAVARRKTRSPSG